MNQRLLTKATASVADEYNKNPKMTVKLICRRVKVEPVYCALATGWVAKSLQVNDTDIRIFALQLEYLLGDFYEFAANVSAHPKDLELQPNA